MKEFPMISYREFDRWLEDGRIRFLVDVREPWMYENDRILGSVNIDRIPREGMTVFYCDRGAKSLAVCRDLWRMGYEVADLAGGMLNYRGKYVDRRRLWDLQ